MKPAQDALRHKLLEEFERRKSKNPSYSIRAFARDLAVSKTALSAFLNNTRSLSSLNVFRLEQFLNPDLASRGETFIHGRKRLQGTKLEPSLNWKHLAILSLAGVPAKASANPEMIATELGLTTQDATLCLKHLIDIEFLAVRNGRMVRNTALFRYDILEGDSNTNALQTEVSVLARHAAEMVPVKDRDFNCIFLPLNERKLKRVRALIEEFHKRIYHEAMRASNKDSVYMLVLDMFPVKPAATASSKPPKD